MKNPDKAESLEGFLAVVVQIRQSVQVPFEPLMDAEALDEITRDVEDAVSEGDPMELTVLAHILTALLEADDVPQATREVFQGLLDKVTTRGEADEAALLERLARGEEQ